MNPNPKDVADLREAQGNVSGAAALRARAVAIATETIATMYVAQTHGGKTNGTAPGDVGGWWKCLDTSRGGPETTEVRHVVSKSSRIDRSIDRSPQICTKSAFLFLLFRSISATVRWGK